MTGHAHGTAALLADLIRAGAQLWIEADGLRYKAAPGVLGPELVAKMRLHKRRLAALVGAERHLAPVSPAQQPLWILAQLDPSTSYNVQHRVAIVGALDLPALERALTHLIRRHEVLTSSYPTIADVPVQVCDRAMAPHLEQVDLSHYVEQRRENALDALCTREQDWRFDLSAGGLARFVLVRLGPTSHRLLVTWHHIITDGSSAGILLRDLAELYAAACAGRPPQLPPLPVQYADFSSWQRAWLDGGVAATQLAYWRDALAGLTVTEIPADYAVRGPRRSAGASIAFTVPPAVTGALRTLAAAHRATLFMATLGGFQALLARYTGRADVAVGSPVANRRRPEVEPLIGCFVNMLVLRNIVAPNASFVELLAEVRRTTLAAFVHQDVPFDRVVDAVGAARSGSETPLFRIAFNLHNQPRPAVQVAGLQFALLSTPRRDAPFDLTISLEERDGALAGQLEYRTDRFASASIRRLAAHYTRLLAAAVADPDRPLATLPLLDAAERAQLLGTGRRAELADVPPLLPEAFAAQAARTPYALAVRAADAALTFAELQQRSCRLAAVLRRHGAGPDVMVGIVLERSTALIVALLAVLEAGAAYVPLDPALPPARLSGMLSDARPAILLAVPETAAALPPCDATLITLPLADEEVDPSIPPLPPARRHPDGVMYVLYTSGSTGAPKGVAVTYRNAASYAARVSPHLALAPEERFALVTTLAADHAYTALFVTLTTGGCLDIIPERIVLDPAKLQRHFEAWPAAVLKVTPSYISALQGNSGFGGLLPARVLMFGGELLPPDLAEAVRTASHSMMVINHYGPTEATVGACLHTVSDDSLRVAGSVPVGRPFSHSRLYVLDVRLEPCPWGTVGELFIGGGGVARGYLNRPASTAAAFVPDPFASQPGARMYRTGDLARWLDSGELQILGRVDRQVKVRGYRVELDEIEHAIRRHPGVQSAAVIAHAANANETRLVAFVVPRPEHRDLSDEVAADLRASLPGYALPAQIVLTDALPSTPSGKIDYATLATLALPAREAGRRPRTGIESRLLKVYRQVLGERGVHVDTDFFQAGGNSLVAIRLAAAIGREFGTRVLPGDILARPTVASLAGLLRLASTDRDGYGVMLQRGTTRVTLCCFPGNGGSALCYSDLTHAMAAEPGVYAFEPPGLWDDAAVPDTVEALANVYLGEVLEIARESEILLVGHSSGGLVAFEIARRLIAAGRPASRLVLLDTTAPDSPHTTAAEADVDWTAAVYRAVGEFFASGEPLATSREPPAGEADLRALSALLYRCGVADELGAVEAARRLVLVFEANHRAARAYRVGTLTTTPVTLFSSDDSAATPWRAFCAGGLSIRPASGGHIRMIRLPHARTLASDLRGLIASPALSAQDIDEVQL